MKLWVRLCHCLCGSKAKPGGASTAVNPQAEGQTMADPTVTDVFKFVAVRPPQPGPEATGGIYLVHDPRAKTAEGKAELTRLTRSAARPGQALDHYRKL